MKVTRIAWDDKTKSALQRLKDVSVIADAYDFVFAGQSEAPLGFYTAPTGIFFERLSGCSSLRSVPGAGGLTEGAGL